MTVFAPDFYPAFRCLAGECPHSCCEGWEVVLDDDTAARYRAVSGEFGARLRRAMRKDEEGETCFPLCGGRCPFLTEENLCEIYSRLGEDALSVTCREHPRFTEDYGAFREITLSASCPAANELLLASDAPLRFISWEDGEAAEEGDAWLIRLLPLRNRVLALLEERTRPLDERLGVALALCERAEEDLDFDASAPFDFSVPDPAPCAIGALTDAELTALQALPALDSDWRAILEKAKTAPAASLPEALRERVAVYFVFRYLLKAVNDGAIASKMRFCAFSLRAVEKAAAVCGLGEALRRYSREIEHDEENLAAVEELAEKLY